MTDRVAILNLALTKMGASDTVVAPDQQSHAATTLNAVWDTVRRACIRGGKRAPRWNFAEGYAETAARVVTVDRPIPPGWTSAFPQPDGALRLAEVVGYADEDWRLVRGPDGQREVLFRGEAPLRAYWLFDVPEPALWDDLFVQTFAARLAYETIDRIAGDLARKSALWSEYEANLSAAAKVDARENPPIELEESGWVLARFGGGAGLGLRGGFYPNGSWPGAGWSAGPK